MSDPTSKEEMEMDRFNATNPPTGRAREPSQISELKVTQVDTKEDGQLCDGTALPRGG